MFCRRLVALIVPIILGAAGSARAGQVAIEPHVTTSGGYDGNYFYDQEVTEQTGVTPLRADGGFDLAWRPTLRWRLSAGGSGALERLYANPVLGTLRSAGGHAGIAFLPSLWSLVTLAGYVERDLSTDPALRFLSARYAGADLTAAYHFQWLTAGVTGAYDNAAFDVLKRSDSSIEAGPYVAGRLAGWWRLDVRYARMQSTWPEIAGAGPRLVLAFRRELWPGGEVRADAGLRHKAYDEANRSDNRWSFGAGLSHAFGDRADAGARLDRTLNRSSLPEDDYSVTTFSCTVSVHPYWSFSY